MKFLIKLSVLLMLFVEYPAFAQTSVNNDIYELSKIGSVVQSGSNSIHFNVAINNGSSLVYSTEAGEETGTVILTLTSNQKLDELAISDEKDKVYKDFSVKDIENGNGKFGYVFELTFKFRKETPSSPSFNFIAGLTLTFELLHCSSLTTDNLKLDLTKNIDPTNTTIINIGSIPIAKFVNNKLYFESYGAYTPCSNQYYFNSGDNYSFFRKSENIFTGVTSNYSLTPIGINQNAGYIYLTKKAEESGKDMTSLTLTSVALDPYESTRVELPGCKISKSLSGPFPTTLCNEGGDFSMFMYVGNTRPSWEGSCIINFGNVYFNGPDWIGKRLEITAPDHVKFLQNDGSYSSDPIVIPSLTSNNNIFKYIIEPGFVIATTEGITATLGSFTSLVLKEIYNPISSKPFVEHTMSDGFTGFGWGSTITDNTDLKNMQLKFTNKEGTLNNIEYFFFEDQAKTIKTFTPSAEEPMFYFGTKTNPTLADDYHPLSYYQSDNSSVLKGAIFTAHFNNTENSFTISNLNILANCDNHLFILFKNCYVSPLLPNGSHNNYHANISNYSFSNSLSYAGYFYVKKSPVFFPKSNIYCSKASVLTLSTLLPNKDFSVALKPTQEYYHVYELNNSSGENITSIDLTENVTTGTLPPDNREIFKIMIDDQVLSSNNYINTSTIDNIYNIKNITIPPGRTFKIFFKRNFTVTTSQILSTGLVIHLEMKVGSLPSKNFTTNYTIAAENPCCNLTQYPITITPEITEPIKCGAPLSLTASTIDVATYVWKSPSGAQLSITSSFQINSVKASNAGKYKVTVTPFTGCNLIKEIDILVDCPPVWPCTECVPSFSPLPGQKYLLSAWVKEDYLPNAMPPTYIRSGIRIGYNKDATAYLIARPSGPIIDGWQRIEYSFTIPATADNIQLALINENATTEAYFDDVRVHPFLSNAKSFVYDPSTQRLVAELDENNYATKYEYDDEGILIRVKKETERGVMTIKESRNNQSKLNK